MHPANLVPELDAAVRPAGPGPRRRRRRPGPASRRPHRADRARPPSGPAHRRPAHPRPWNGGCRAPQPPMPPPRTTRPRRPAGAAPHPARNLDRHTPPGHPHPGAGPRPAPSHRRRHPRRRPARGRLPGKAAPTPICRHSPAGSPPKPNSRKPACPAASTARTKSTSATTTKFSLRYSDDGHIARELGEPPSAGPAHNISGPRCRGQAGYPRVSTRAGPGSHSPARAGPGSGRAGFGPGRVRAAEPWPSRAGGSHRPGPARAGPRVGRRAHYHGCPAGTAAGHHERGPRRAATGQEPEWLSGSAAGPVAALAARRRRGDVSLVGRKMVSAP